MATIGNAQDATCSTTPFGWQRFVLLEEQAHLVGEDGCSSAVPCSSAGFTYEGHRVPLLGPQGIFKPRVLTVHSPEHHDACPSSRAKPGPTTMRLARTVYSAIGIGGRILRITRLRLRQAMEQRAPLIYFHGIVPGLYGPSGPSSSSRRSDTADVHSQRGRTLVRQPRQRGGPGRGIDDTTGDIARGLRQRLHQTAFRERVRSCLPASLRRLSAQAERAHRGCAHPARRRPSR